ncbi:carbohydrate kinase family protein [Nocardia suismassiliense]|uniref:carbohydrate kinase family protein n=1 Tax=Nocardia suismassiliense TaxID=2077092 RepID=UPI000D1EB09C|nr:carbohydrate kinase family protein [Nocardia suismassiliense]
MGTDPAGRADAATSSNSRQHRTEVLVVGAYFADLVFHGLTRPVQPGTEVFASGFAILPGGAFTPAMAMRRLGHDVVWSTDFGTDLFSEQVLAAARAEGLDDSGFRLHTMPVRSVTAALSSPEDRAMVSYQDPVTAFPLATLLREHRARVVILPQLLYGATVYAALDVAHRLGTQVFMDCQDVPCTLDTPTVREILAKVDIFAPNADEALRLTGAPTLDTAIDILADLVKTLVVKRGSGGAIAVRDGERCEIDAVAVEVVDTTAAGDCFNAGFLHAHLAGHSLPDCLATAVACGAAATTALGSSAAPDLTELPGWLARVPRAHQV